MRILCLTTSFPTLDQQWRGVFVKDWAHFMDSQGVEIQMLGPASPHIDAELTYHGYRHFGGLLSGQGAPEFLSKHPFKGSVFGVGTTMSMARQLKRHLHWAEHIVAHWN